MKSPRIHRPLAPALLLVSLLASIAAAHPVAPTFDARTGCYRLPRPMLPALAGDLSAPGDVPAAAAACEWVPAPNVRVHPDESANQHLWPDIALGPGGLVAVAWMDDHAPGGYHIFYSTSIDGGLTWSTPEKIDNRAAGSYSKFVDLEFTPSGIPVAVWEDDRLGGINAYFSKRDPGAGGTPWTPSLKLNTTGGPPSGTDFMNLSIAVLDNNRYFVAWTDWREGPFHQVYGRSTTTGGASWGTETRVSDGLGYQPVAGDPCLIVDPTSGSPGTERLYCVTNDWRGNVPGGRYPNLYAYRSTNGGASWSVGVMVNDIEPLYQQSSSHALVRLTDGTLCAGWLNNLNGPSQFRTSVSTDQGQTWSASAQVDPGIGGGTGTYSSIAAHGGSVFAGFDVYEGNWNAYLRVSTDGGRTWTADACRIDDDATAAPTGNTVLVAASPGEVFAAWSDGRPSFGAWKIYATRATLPTTAAGLPPVGVTASLSCVPNPAPAGTPVAITWDATVVGTSLDVYDALGRSIQSLDLGAAAARAAWDGRDRGGRSVPAGIYWIRLSNVHAEPLAVARVVRLR